MNDLTSSRGRYAGAIKFFAPLLPYAAVSIGLLLLHSAWAAIVSYHVLAVVIVLFNGERREPLNRIFQGIKIRYLIAALCSGVLAGLFLYFLWPVLGISNEMTAYFGKIGLGKAAWPLFLIYFIAVNPVIEEYYWRYYLGSVSPKPVLNDFWFAGYHLLVLVGNIAAVWLLGAFILLAAGAWLWRQLNRRNGGILASTFSHLAADASILLVVYYMSFT
jgi:hypothetical protein